MLEHRLHVDAEQMLLSEIMVIAHLAPIKNTDDIRMLDSRGDFSLVLKHAHHLLILPQVREEPFEGDPLMALSIAVACFENLGHTADGDSIDDDVVAE